jgi:hypothetical protein
METSRETRRAMRAIETEAAARIAAGESPDTRVHFIDDNPARLVCRLACRWPSCSAAGTPAGTTGSATWRESDHA